jgi:hypothetical protein
MSWVDRVYKYGGYVITGGPAVLIVVGLATSDGNGHSTVLEQPTAFIIISAGTLWAGTYLLVFRDRLTRQHYDRLARIWAKHPGFLGRLLTMGNFRSPDVHRVHVAVCGCFALLLSLLFLMAGLQRLWG